MHCLGLGGTVLFLDSASKGGVIYRFLQMAHFTLIPPKAQRLWGCFVEQGGQRAEMRAAAAAPGHPVSPVQKPWAQGNLALEAGTTRPPSMAFRGLKASLLICSQSALAAGIL